MAFIQYKLEYKNLRVSAKAALAELVAMALFVFIGCGTATMFARLPAIVATQSESKMAERQLMLAMSTYGSWGITTALAFGMAIMFLVYTFGHISGGQINCAVTWGLALAGHLGPAQALVNFIAQLIGSLLGAGLLYGVVPGASESRLGSNGLFPGINPAQAVLGEAVMTFTLVFVVLMTAAWPKSVAQNLAPFAIGMSVFAAHAVLLPVDGCSINPTRSFGPAVVSQTFNHFWVFWVGPLTGSTLAVFLYWLFRSPYDTVGKEETNAAEPDVEFRGPKSVRDSPSSQDTDDRLRSTSADLRA